MSCFMRNYLIFVGTPGLLLLAGCPSTNVTSGTITEEEYRKGLQIHASVEDQQVVVSVSSANAPNNLHEVLGKHLVSAVGEHKLGDSRGLHGVSVTRRIALADCGGDEEALEKIVVRYQVWDGEPSKGTRLFEGTKAVPFRSGLE